MEDEDINLSDIPELTPEMFAKAVIKRGLKDKENKAQVTLRVDPDVLRWFKSQGHGYQTRINSLLRAYMEANLTTPHGKSRGVLIEVPAFESQPRHIHDRPH